MIDRKILWIIFGLLALIYGYYTDSLPKVIAGGLIMTFGILDRGKDKT